MTRHILILPFLGVLLATGSTFAERDGGWGGSPPDRRTPEQRRWDDEKRRESKDEGIRAEHARNVSHEYPDPPACLPYTHNFGSPQGGYYLLSRYGCGDIYSNTYSVNSAGAGFIISLPDHFALTYLIRSYAVSSSKGRGQGVGAGSRKTGLYRVGSISYFDFLESSVRPLAETTLYRAANETKSVVSGLESYTYMMFEGAISRANLVNELESRSIDPLSSHDLKLQIEIGAEPRRINVDTEYTLYHGVEANYLIEVYAEKSSLAVLCQTLSGRRQTEQRVEEVASMALEKLVNFVKSSQTDLNSVLKIYLEENERVLNDTITALSERQDVLGPDGAVILAQLRGVSVLQRSTCLHGWDVDRIQREPQPFLARVNECRIEGEISATQTSLLKSLSDGLGASAQEGQRALKRLAVDLGELPEIAARAKVLQFDVAARASELLSFLKARNTNAYDMCRSYLSWAEH